MERWGMASSSSSLAHEGRVKEVFAVWPLSSPVFLFLLEWQTVVYNHLAPATKYKRTMNSGSIGTILSNHFYIDKI